MKRLLLASLALSLSACTLLQSGHRLTVAGQVLTLSNPGAAPLGRAVVVLSGPSAVTPSQGSCEATQDGITACHLGDVAKAASLTFEGPLVNATATWRTPDGGLGSAVYAR